MIPSKLKDLIDQYLGIQPSEEELNALTSKVNSFGLSQSDQLEVLEYMDRVFNTSPEEIEAMRKLQEAEKRAEAAGADVKAMKRESELLQEAREKAEGRTRLEQKRSNEYERELQAKKFTVGKLLKDFGYGYCAVFVVTFGLTVWFSLSCGNELGFTIFWGLITALLVSILARVFINEFKK